MAEPTLEQRQTEDATPAAAGTTAVAPVDPRDLLPGIEPERRLDDWGYRFHWTTRETIGRLREHQRLAPLLRDRTSPYRYEREVEDFLRWSPSVRRDPEAEWRPSRQQIAELRRALDAIERDAATIEADSASSDIR